MIKSRDAIIAIVVLLVAVAIIVGVNRNRSKVSGYVDPTGRMMGGDHPGMMEKFADAPKVEISKVHDVKKPEEKKEKFENENDPALEQLRQASCFPKSTLSAEELLPQDDASLWAQTNPNGAGSLQDRNLLQAGALIGINTVGQTMKNANLGLRSEVPNVKVPVSPWLNSSFEPDLNRRPFELGGCA